MSDTTRLHAPDERAPSALTVLPANNLNIASNDTANTTPGVAPVIMPQYSQSSQYSAPTQPLAQNPPNTLLISRLTEALETGHATLNHMITSLPDKWREVNNKGTLITKHILLQCIWEKHTETDGLHNLQQAIITAYPPTHTHVTQYTCHLTPAINRDS